MLDGVEWAAAEIVFYMLLATLIGFAIAYVFIRWFQKESFAESFEADLAAQQELTRRAEYRLIDSNEELDKVHLELKGEQQRVHDLQAELESTQASLAELEAAVPDESELEQLKVDLEASRAEAAAGAVQLSELEAAKAAAEEAAAGRDATVEDLEQALEAERQESAVLQQRLAELESAREASDQRRAELEARVAELEQGAVAPAVEETDNGLEEPDGSSEEDVPSHQEGLARIAEIAARTAGDDPLADDDLKLVHGIGPKLERTLKGLGITSFRQIASFEAEDIAYVTAALDAFKGRIERDDWMGSAAAEYLAKYGEPL